MLYPQNSDRIVTIDSVTLLHPMYMVIIKTARIRIAVLYRYWCTIQFELLVFVTGGYTHAAFARAGILRLIHDLLFFHISTIESGVS